MWGGALPNCVFRGWGGVAHTVTELLRVASRIPERAAKMADPPRDA